MKTSRKILLPFLLLAMAGCGGGKKIPATPDAAVKEVAQGLSQDQPQVIWQSLPPSYQKDVNSVVGDFAAKMDPEVYNKGFTLVQKLVKVLETKRDLILQHPLVMNNVNQAEGKKNWDAVVKIPSTLVNSDIADLNKLKSLDIENFMATTGADLMSQIDAVSKLAPPKDGAEIKDFKNTLRGVKATVIKKEGNSAQVKIEVPGQKSSTEDWVQVEGRWVPKKMADSWKKTIADAKASIAKMKDQIKDKDKTLASMKMMDGILDSLLAAKTTEEFNQALMPVMGMMMGGMGGMGGPGGMGPGGMPKGPVN